MYGRALPPLFLDQTEAQKAEKNFFRDSASPLALGLDARPLPPPPHPLSECLACLDPPLNPVEDKPTRWSFLPEPGEDMDIPPGLLQGGVIRIIKQLQVSIESECFPSNHYC